MSLNCFQYYVAICNCQFTKHTTPTTCIVALLHIFAKLALIAEFRSVPIQYSALSNPWYICICVSFSMRICIRMWICIWMSCAAQNFTAWMLPPRWRCLPCLRIPQVSCACLPPSQYLYFCISLTLIKGSCTSFPPEQYLRLCIPVFPISSLRSPSPNSQAGDWKPVCLCQYHFAFVSTFLVKVNSTFSD